MQLVDGEGTPTSRRGLATRRALWHRSSSRVAAAELATYTVPVEERLVRPMDRNGVLLFAIPMALTTILAWVGDAMAPTLLISAPAALILCNPRIRNLVLVAPTMSPIAFIPIAIFRLLATDPFFYWFGQRYGDAAIRWMENKLGSGAFVVLWLERLFARTSYATVVVLPNQWICLLAGATRMKVWVFATLNVVGTVARVVLIWKLGDIFASPILHLNHWIGAHRIELTLLTIALVAFGVWRGSRKGRLTVESPSELAEELHEAEDEVGKPL